MQTFTNFRSPRGLLTHAFRVAVGGSPPCNCGLHLVFGEEWCGAVLTINSLLSLLGQTATHQSNWRRI